MPSSVTATKRRPATSVVPVGSQPRLPCWVDPVSPVWKANQPMTTVARKPAGTTYPFAPNVRIAVSAKLSPLRPAR